MRRAAAIGFAAALALAAPAAATPIVSGTDTIVDPTHGSYTAELDYAVYDAAAPDNPAPSAGDLTFVYTLNNLASSDVALIGLGIQVPPGTAQVGASFVDGSGVEPDEVNVLASEVRWEFGTQSPFIEPGQSSESLTLTAPFAPGDVAASLNGDFALDAPATVVGPVPEPGTGLLLAAGLGALALRRRASA